MDNGLTWTRACWCCWLVFSSWKNSMFVFWGKFTGFCDGFGSSFCIRVGRCALSELHLDVFFFGFDDSSHSVFDFTYFCFE